MVFIEIILYEQIDLGQTMKIVSKLTCKSVMMCLNTVTLSTCLSKDVCKCNVKR